MCKLLNENYLAGERKYTIRVGEAWVYSSDCIRERLIYYKNREGWLVGCRNKDNSPLVGPETDRGVPSMGVILRNPSPYLREFRRKHTYSPRSHKRTVGLIPTTNQSKKTQKIPNG